MEKIEVKNRVLRRTGKRKSFNLLLSVREIEGLLDRLPEEDEVYKFFPRAAFPVSASFDLSRNERKFFL